MSKRAGAPDVLELYPETIILDMNGAEIVRINGVVPLPIGATVQLGPSMSEAKVIQVRLQCGSTGQPALLCLDVEVPPPGYSG